MATNREIFDEIAESWYRFRHRSRFSIELKEIAERWRGGRLINVGCAHGPDFVPFKDEFELWGIDFSVEMVKLARKYAGKFNFTANLAVADAAWLPFADNTFDHAIALATYHHLYGAEQRARAFRELKRVLKPGSELFLTVWNRSQPRFWLKGRNAYMAWRTKKQTFSRYYYLYSYAEIEKILRDVGFRILKSYPERSYRFPVKLFSRNICILAVVN
jgi:ubiquinone/menaquinone biosynthesis C-methylase UbiE